MMKKVWLILLAVVLVFGLALLGCGSKNNNKPPEGEDFEFEGDFVYTLWGNNPPVYNETTKLLEFDDVDSSMGFIIKFSDIGYTYSAGDKLKFTYYVEVEKPAVAFLIKGATEGSNALDEPSGKGGAGYGQGKGWEVVLGHDTLSVYEGPLVEGTWDPETKTGTFEVLMMLFKSSITGLGFQHNIWCDMGGGGKIAEESKYKLKFIKVENGASDIEVVTPPPTDVGFFDEAEGLTEGIGTYGGGAHDFDETTGIITISGNGGFWVNLPAGFTVADTVVIEYACVNTSEEGASPVKFIKKQHTGWDDVADSDLYPTFNTEEVSTITVTGFDAAGVTAGKAYFQTNGATEALIKIISVTRIAGEDMKVTTAVSGIKPVSGEAPLAAVPETDQFTGTITWKDSSDVAVTGDFAEGTAYTATIALTAKTGYTFDGVAANTIAVVGADTVTHAAGTTTTLTITAVFPETAAAAPDLPITFTAGSETGLGKFNANLDVTATGFTVTQTNQYDWSCGYIEVDFGSYTLGDYESLDFTYQGVQGDIASKQVRVWVFSSDTDIANPGSTSLLVDNNAVKSANVTGTTAIPLTVSLAKFSALAAEQTVLVAFNIWAGTTGNEGGTGVATTFTISDIKFHNNPAP